RDYRVLSPPPALAHRAGHAWEQLVLPLRARGAQLLCPANVAPLAHPRTAVVIHDCAALREPSWYSPAYARWQAWLLPRIARRAARVITVSSFSRAEIASLLGVDAEVVPGGVDHVRFRPDLQGPGTEGDVPAGVEGAGTEGYVLTVASG